MDLNDLPEQFPDPAAGFNPMQQKWYAGLLAGAAIDPAAMQAAMYQAVVTAFQAQAGAVPSSKAKFLAMKRAEQEFYRTVAAEHAGRYKAQQNVVDAAVLFALSGQGSTPREALEAGGVPTAEVRRISGKPGAKRKVKKSLQKHQQHPNAQRMIQTEGKREYLRMADNTLAGSLEGVYVNMRTQARLAKLEHEQAAQAAEIAELKARLAGIDARHAVEDAGLDLKTEALRMYSTGLGYKAVGRALGCSPSTVQSWVRRAAQGV